MKNNGWMQQANIEWKAMNECNKKNIEWKATNSSEESNLQTTKRSKT